MSPGTKVICIDAKIHNKEFTGACFQQWVEVDAVYTIREIFDNDGIVTSVLLEELRNIPVPIHPLGGIIREPAFIIDRFRELTESELDALEYEATNELIEVNILLNKL